MVTETLPTTLTWEAYRRAFETEAVSMERYEILDGRKIPLTAPTVWHQYISSNIFSLLKKYATETLRCFVLYAPTDVLIQETPLRVRQPDVLLISAERLQAQGGLEVIGPLRPAPELVVEILSQSETRRSVTRKLDDYADAGVQECWIVSREAETVEQLRLTPEGAERAGLFASTETFASLAFPDLTVAVADLFAG